VNGAVMFRLLFASSGNSPLTTNAPRFDQPSTRAGRDEPVRSDSARAGADAVAIAIKPGDGRSAAGEQDGFHGDGAVREQRGGSRYSGCRRAAKASRPPRA